MSRLPSGTRQRADAAEMLQRWATYLTDTTSTSVSATQANAAFAGFNIAVDNVLSSEQTRFIGQLDQATQRLGGLNPWSAVAGLFALILLGYGVERRAGEYR